ncbi:MAG: ATP-binding protein [Cyclobacteriaceae bacterium]|nr:ATP-binding protein [Cyclobacteriaceae bacterium]UYN86194.1 MAG: ATP-binding protein [Cyclobacteriaceae bacterium]
MIKRIVEFSRKNSLFLFGARGTGKTHLLKERYAYGNNWYIDLLNPEVSRKYLLSPAVFVQELAARKPAPEWVIIDEVQKVPALLDLIHQQIESTKQKFILSGSSARKLKRGAANLLAGRAFVYNLYPLTAKEIGNGFDLHEALHWGTLPKLLDLPEVQDKKEFLRAYANTYLREEILQEQIIRKLEPFQRFLPVAAQMAGKVINYSKIAFDTGTSVPTIQSYFQILEDTLLGFTLPQFHESIRKRQRSNPKFYFFDTGIQRTLLDELNTTLNPRTSQYGNVFEQFIINEINRLQSYYRKDYRLSYLLTGAGVEIDLIIERPGLKRAAVEIKSTTTITQSDLRGLLTLGKDIPDCELFCLSNDSTPKIIEGVQCLPWQAGLSELGL